MADKKKENDWLQTLVDQNRNRSTIGHEHKPLLSETSEQKIGRMFYPNSTGAPAAERWAAAQKQKAAIEAQRPLKASQQRAKDETAKSAFGKPEAPSFDSKVSPPGRPKPQFLRLREEPIYINKNNGAVQHHHFKLAIDGPDENKPPRPPKIDVTATPEMEQKIIEHLQSLNLPEKTIYGQNEEAYTLGNDGEVRLFKGKTERAPTQSSCKPGDKACLHIHPEYDERIDKQTGLLKDGRKPDFAHSNVFGPLDWAPVEVGQPNFMLGPDGDWWVLEAKDGKYVPRFIAKRFAIFKK